MKHFLCSLVLWSVCLRALGDGAAVDVAKLRTFSSIGKKPHDPPDTRFTTYTWIYQW
jgi:hypothetical protein